MKKTIIKNFNIDEAVDFFISQGEKEYRARQLFTWLYNSNITDFDEMTTFSKSLRSVLKDQFILSPLELCEREISSVDGAEKFLFRTYDGHYIESVLIKDQGTGSDRMTVCVSSQVGCAMGCTFCETAKLGFKRNLEAGEIIDQLCHVRRISGQLNNNIVFMGMGEPFMNYDNVLRASDIMNYTFGFHISVRKITISTCGIKDSLERFIDEKRPYNLALSLNDTQPEIRKQHMPVENKFPFADIISLLDKKFPVSKNRLTIAYVMRKDNISSDDARRLKKMFKYTRIKLNLIPLTGGSHEYDLPTKNEIEKFVHEMEIMNVPVSIRKSLGSDISGACGQLSGKRRQGDTCLL